MMNFQKTVVLLLLCLLCATPAFAQKKGKKGKKKKGKKTVIEEGTKAMELKSYEGFSYDLPAYDIVETTTEIADGEQNAFEILIPNVKPKEVQKRWKKTIKKKKAKDMDTDLAFVVEGATVEGVSKVPITVYAKFKERETGTKLLTLYDLGEGNFISSDANEESAKDVQQFLTNFARSFAKDEVDDELGGAKKELKSYNKTLKNLKKDNEKYHNNIAKYKRMIAEAEEAIEVNLQDQDKAKFDIKNQEIEVDHVTKKLKIFDK